RLAHGLSPLSLEGQNLKETIADFLEEQTGLHPRIRFRAVHLRSTKDVDPDSATQLYFIAREAVINAIKHSEATDISVRVLGDKDRVKLKVADNGVGSPDSLSATNSEGLGLRFMQYRARILGGTITIDTGLDEKGVSIVCEAPRKPNPE
ncbi:MAG: ATP-binding protein, partial [Verrucomicrobiota bacterium]